MSYAVINASYFDGRLQFLKVLSYPSDFFFTSLLWRLLRQRYLKIGFAQEGLGCVYLSALLPDIVRHFGMMQLFLGCRSQSDPREGFSLGLASLLT